MGKESCPDWVVGSSFLPAARAGARPPAYTCVHTDTHIHRHINGTPGKPWAPWDGVGNHCLVGRPLHVESPPGVPGSLQTRKHSGGSVQDRGGASTDPRADRAARGLNRGHREKCCGVSIAVSLCVTFPCALTNSFPSLLKRKHN